MGITRHKEVERAVPSPRRALFVSRSLCSHVCHRPDEDDHRRPADISPRAHVVMGDPRLLDSVSRSEQVWVVHWVRLGLGSQGFAGLPDPKLARNAGRVA